MRVSDAVVLSRVCLGWEHRHGRFLVHLSEVAEDHPRKCDGLHGGVVGVFRLVSAGVCDVCGVMATLYTPTSAGYQAVCKDCVECSVMEAWLLMVARVREWD
jgi:hypothetical protein